MREITPSNTLARIERTAHSVAGGAEGVTPITFIVLGALVLLSVLMVGCGNKGDLFLPSDVIAVEELEDAAEKLKKRKPETTE